MPFFLVQSKAVNGGHLKLGNTLAFDFSYCTYCKSGNFREHFIFANSVKRHICDVKNLQLGHALPISKRQIDFAISRGFYFRETLAKISEFTVHVRTIDICIKTNLFTLKNEKQKINIFFQF